MKIGRGNLEVTAARRVKHKARPRGTDTKLNSPWHSGDTRVRAQFPFAPNTPPKSISSESTPRGLSYLPEGDFTIHDPLDVGGSTISSFHG